MQESLEDRVRRLTQETIDIVACDPDWPRQFADERAHLEACLPPGIVRRIEHFGSTSVPGLASS